MLDLPKDIFFKQIEEKIKSFTPKRIVFFAWLCSMRVFPFIGGNKNINFWGKNNRSNQHLYALINALDNVAIYGDNYFNTTSARNAVRTVRATADSVRNFAYALVPSTAAHNAALCAYDAIHTIIHATDAACAATKDFARCTAATVSCVRDAVDSANRYKIQLPNIIWDDILYIEKNIYDKFKNDIDVYGNIWDNFHEILNNISCSYWSILYKDIFHSGFQVDKEHLRLRLSVPREIKEQGAKVVANYLEQIESTGSENLNEARIIILGEKGAGKTCLARKLIDPDAMMTESNESTEGVVNTIWKIEDKETSSTLNVHVWDFAGHVITHAAHRCFLSERCLYILVYDGRTERRNQIEYWLDHVKNYGGDAPVLIFINKFDEHKPDIPENTLKKKYSFIKDFVYFSIDKDKNDLKEFRVNIFELIHNNPIWNNQRIPLSYYKVKNALSRLFEGKNFDNEHITREKFNTIASENGVDAEEQENLLESLHFLGISLWYKDIDEFSMLILNPDWITNGIYKVINWAHNESRSTIYFNDFENIFNVDEKTRYPEPQFRFILKLMIKYELAYSKGDSGITIPHLLNEDQPAKLPDFPIEDSLMIKYVSEQPLPPNTVCRLIVRHHEDIKSDNGVWRYGVILKYKKNTTALVYEIDRNIIITVNGNHKIEYILKLRETMDEIFNTYRSQKPELQLRIIEVGEYMPTRTNNNNSIVLSYETIKSHIENGIQYFDPQSKSHINLNITAETFQINNTGPITINFHDCNIQLQGDLSNLIRSLNKNGYENETQVLESALSNIEELGEMNDKNEVKESGSLTKLISFLKEASDKNSSIRKAIEKINNGREIAGRIADKYNTIAKWIGFPQTHPLIDLMLK
jgi:small GTP-binding protein